ncbi:phage tail assembly protein [Peribacillus aracenensis]|uniref:phage tail assembly protein n=1 Tax=Peribacillus aracenensis TaxID=2976708 RepID=UPI0021A42931|nr:phage tail assembly protein [Peribacillus sp. BBB004]
MSANENIIELKKTYTFEGKEYKELDFSPLEDLTAADLIEADKIFGTTGQFAVVNEMTLGYTLIVASTATHTPIEFFNQLGASDALKVKNKVMGFLNN